jgi:hypothetical protein
METSPLTVNGTIKTALLQRTRHSRLEPSSKLALDGVPLFGSMIVVLMLMAGDWISVKVRLMLSVSLTLELEG